METVKSKAAPGFLRGGGEMGALIRAYDWTATSLGAPDGWPQTLRTTLGILLRSRFPMYLLWGKDCVGFYNDAYRPSLGANGKHPGALGRPGAEVWPEAWPAIKPMLDGLMAGAEAVWSEDQLMPLYRNGTMEDAYWTFSWSAVLDEEGNPAGVLAVCSETTKAVARLKPLKEKELSLELAVEIGELGVFNVDLATNTAAYSQRIMNWFALPDQRCGMDQILSKVHPDDQPFVAETIERSVAGEWDGKHDITYRLVDAGGGLRHLRSIGQVQYKEGKATFILGIVQDATEQITARRKIEQGQQELLNLFEESPVGIATIRGDDDLVFESANAFYRELVDRQPEELIGKPLLQALPEIREQGFDKLLKEVIATGKPFIACEAPVAVVRSEKLETIYLNFTYQPQREADGRVSGVLVVAVDISQQVKARKKIEESEAKLRSIIANAPPAIGLFIGRDLVIELPNQTFIDIVGKGPDIEGKPLREVMPELLTENQPFLQILDDVFTSGKTFQSFGSQVKILRQGVMTDNYYNITYSPLRDAEGKIYGILDVAVDVTGEVMARKALEESEGRFQNLVRDATVGIVVLTGAEMKVEIVNESYGRLINLTPADLVGKNLFDIIPEAEEYYRPLLNKVLQNGEPVYLYDSPYSVVINGERVEGFLNVVYQPYRNAEGNITGVMALCQDVTERVFGRKQLEESEAKFRSLIEEAPVATCLFRGRDLIVEVANPQMIELWGKDETILNKPLVEAVPELKGQPFLQILEDVYTSGQAYTAQSAPADLVRNGVKGTYYFDFTYKPLRNAAGEVYAVMDMAVEVTEQVLSKRAVEESEAALRNAIELAELATWRLNIKEGTFGYSPRFMQWLGFTEDTKDADAAYNPLPDKYRESVPAAVAAAIAPGSSGVYDNEHPVVNRLTGQVRIIHAQAKVQYNAAGEPEALSGLAQDVTKERELQRALEFQVQQRTEELHAVNEELQAANEELARANTALQQNNRELEQFAYIASHDLQEPLRKVSTFTEMLRTNLGEVDPRSQTYLTKISASTARMLQLIKDVLNFSQLSESREAFVPVDLNAVVAQLAADFELLIEQKGAVIRCGNLPTLHAVPLQMQQLFGNLVSNALKFTRTDVPPVVSVTAQPFAPTHKTVMDGLLPDREYVHIKVTDNGIGFSQEYAAQIFGIFQRLHGRTEYAGTGIGLALCKKIAQNHGGEIWADAVEGTGAVFNILLPLKQG